MLPDLNVLPPARFETTAILKAVASAGRALAELKGAVGTIPHQGILINTLTLQEAKDSSEIENIVTTHDQLYQRESADDETINPATKEVLRYRQALWTGYQTVKASGLLTNNHLLEIQAVLEENHAGFRKVPGTTLKNRAGTIIYTPPQSGPEVENLMADLERFIHADPPYDADPLVRMALIHHQFESIHPFYDGNGRTGRILNVLYLVKEGLLDVPVLYLSRHIVRTKADYYRLLQAVREGDAWEEWVLYMLTAVEFTARDATRTISLIREALLDAKHRIRSRFKFYSQDLINNLFTHPYTKIAFIENDLKVSRPTAASYLEALAAEGFLEKRRIGRTNYYLNQPLIQILTRE